MKIYTKTGDDGTTGLLGSRPGRQGRPADRGLRDGRRAERRARPGPGRSGLDADADALLARLQDDLFAVGAALADPDPDGPVPQRRRPTGTPRGSKPRSTGSKPSCPRSPGSSSRAGRPPRRSSTWPGPSAGGPSAWSSASATSPARHVPAHLVVYLNRLSDFLFVLARAVNHRAGVADIPWAGL